MTWALLLAAVVAQAPAASTDDEPFDAGLFAAAVDAGLDDGPLLKGGVSLNKPPFPIRFTGNVVLTEEVYRAVLDVPSEALPETETAQLVADQVQRFLLKSGYELSTVTVALEDGGLTVRIDEGRLEKVVFRGRFTLPMLRFKIALDLPKEVFNRPLLEREVALRAKELGIEPPTWELIETSAIKHDGVQMLETPTIVIAGRSLIRTQQRFELHFTFGELAWSTGLGVDVRTSWMDGLEVGLNYQSKSLAFANDRWRVALMGGLGLRNDLPQNNIYIFPSRVIADAIWYSPPIDESGTSRGFLSLHSEGIARQRRDFGLENYFALRTELSFNVQVKPHRTVSSSPARACSTSWSVGCRPRSVHRRPSWSPTRRACAASWRRASTSSSSTVTPGGTAATPSSSRAGCRRTSRASTCRCSPRCAAPISSSFPSAGTTSGFAGRARG